jgi:RHS repeat-associated protein
MASVHYNETLQDLNYWYDPVGNITQVNDGAQQTLFYANTLIDPTQKFTYDALYRLIKTEGREQIGTNTFGPDDNTKDAAWKVHLGSDAAQLYVQKYTYDEVGNILELKHCADNNSYTRTYNYTNANNRLNSTVTDITPATVYSYTYDNRGNMITMPHLSAMDWNATNELRHITRGTNDTSYQYSGGQRIRKYTDKGTIQEERIYLGSFEIYRKFEGSSLIVKRTTVHVSDDTGRIAMLEHRIVGDAEDDNDTDPTMVRYVYSNHLQSASLELNGGGEIISYEEYHPYGTTAYQAKNCDVKAVAKRYRYTGKERDDESGLYYHGARYYVAWLGRWCAVDPLESKYAGWSPYHYVRCNPVMDTDSTGMGGDNDSISAPVSELTGQTATYTDVFNYYDSNGNITYSNTSTSFDDIPGREHGLYVHNNHEKSLGSSKIVKDGGATYAVTSEYIADPESFTPYNSNPLKEVGQEIWAAYKMSDPIGAGEINGTWNFASGTVAGLWHLAYHPEDAIIGVAKFAYYANANSYGFITPDVIEYDAQIYTSVSQTYNKFKNGDTYTRTSMGTEAVLTVASIFWGGAEGETLGWSSKSLKVAEAELNVGKTEVWLKTQSEAEELFLRRFQSEGYRNSEGFTSTAARDFFSQEKGFYHWDVEFETIQLENGGIKEWLKQHALNNKHGADPHLQIEPKTGPRIYIFWPKQ